MRRTATKARWSPVLIAPRSTDRVSPPGALPTATTPSALDSGTTPPFPAQVMLNGHEHVACRARAAGVSFLKEGNCFTTVADPDGLARIADTLSHPATAGRLGQAIDRWIYTACLCFGLDIADQQATLFRYSYSIYQIEYSRNLLFRSGRQMERVFDAIVDRTRSRLDIPRLRTMFGSKQRPRTHGGLSPRVAAVMEI